MSYQPIPTTDEHELEQEYVPVSPPNKYLGHSGKAHPNKFLLAISTILLVFLGFKTANWFLSFDITAPIMAHEKKSVG